MRTIWVSLLLAVLATPLVAQRHTCAFTSYGSSCGPVLTGKVTPNGNTNFVTMTLTNAGPKARVLMIIGGVRWDVDLRPIFGGTLACSLLVRPSFLQQHLADPTGKYVWGHALPSTYVGVAYGQVAVLRPDGKVLTTNGLKLTCK